ncbi:hypothetical protein OsI_22939 [Oryza sativa Indica Group]|uniref:Uncharacterized protein n=1 Tax=Oryza sativa subsp. indica TaxID=39946 RepID=B8B209_ORYSI|nr:hypothetical protein OsI_22939 [Oryza sativa Indica Group]
MHQCLIQWQGDKIEIMPVDRDSISKDDIKVFTAVPSKPGAEFPNAARWEQKLNLEIVAAKKQRDHYLSNVEKSCTLKHIQERRKKYGNFYELAEILKTETEAGRN